VLGCKELAGLKARKAWGGKGNVLQIFQNNSNK
jgi:hypothetical protein